MMTLFNKLTSCELQFRSYGNPITVYDTNYRLNNPLWARLDHGIFHYSIHPMVPLRANKEVLDRYVPNRRLTSVKDTRIGLALAMSEASPRIKSFRFGDAIVYSYCRDLRFVTFICLLMGIWLWWMDVPILLFQNTKALQSPDLGFLVRVMKDTYVNHLCSTHGVPSQPM
jgi:hypothetical protein